MTAYLGCVQTVWLGFVKSVGPCRMLYPRRPLGVEVEEVDVVAPCVVASLVKGYNVLFEGAEEEKRYIFTLRPDRRNTVSRKKRYI